MNPPLACDVCGGRDEECDACEGRGFAMVRSCPRKLIDPVIWEAMRLRSATKKGWGMPEPGGLLDQTQGCLQAYEMIDQEDSLIQSEELKSKPNG